MESELEESRTENRRSRKIMGSNERSSIICHLNCRLHHLAQIYFALIHMSRIMSEPLQRESSLGNDLSPVPSPTLIGITVSWGETHAEQTNMNYDIDECIIQLTQIIYSIWRKNWKGLMWPYVRERPELNRLNARWLPGCTQTLKSKRRAERWMERRWDDEPTTITQCTFEHNSTDCLALSCI